MKKLHFLHLNQSMKVKSALDINFVKWLAKKIDMKPAKSYWKHFQISVKIIFKNIEDERFNFGNKTNYIMTNG